MSTQHGDGFAQGFISGHVSVGVVDELEAVKIKQDQPKAVVAESRTRKFLFQNLLSRVAIERATQRIDRTLDLEAGDELCLMHSNLAKLGERTKGLHPDTGKVAPLNRVKHNHTVLTRYIKINRNGKHFFEAILLSCTPPWFVRAAWRHGHIDDAMLR